MAALARDDVSDLKRLLFVLEQVLQVGLQQQRGEHVPEDDRNTEFIIHPFIQKSSRHVKETKARALVAISARSRRDLGAISAPALALVPQAHGGVARFVAHSVARQVPALQGYDCLVN